MLGALLEKSGVPYNIFERAAAVKPLGMSIVNTKKQQRGQSNDGHKDENRGTKSKST